MAGFELPAMGCAPGKDPLRGTPPVCPLEARTRPLFILRTYLAKPFANAFLYDLFSMFDAHQFGMSSSMIATDGTAVAVAYTDTRLLGFRVIRLRAGAVGLVVSPV